MCAQQDLHIMKFMHLLMIDSDEALLCKTFHFHAVMYNVALAIELRTLCQFFFSFLDGSGHTEAETAAIVYFYLKHISILGVKSDKEVKDKRYVNCFWR